MRAEEYSNVTQTGALTATDPLGKSSAAPLLPGPPLDTPMPRSSARIELGSASRWRAAMSSRRSEGEISSSRTGFRAAWLRISAGINIVNVPYKGAAPALQDVIAGHVQMMFATASSVVPHIRDGKVRPLAVATLKRTAVLPDIPTIDELGIKNFDATTWHGLVAPAHTPKDVIATLNRALAAALDDPDVKTSLAALGVDVIGGTPEEFAAYIKSEIPKWAAIIKASGAKLD